MMKKLANFLNPAHNSNKTPLPITHSELHIPKYSETWLYLCIFLYL